MLMQQKCLDFIISEFDRDSISKELAVDIWVGIGRDNDEDWTKEQFFKWVKEMETKFNQYTPEEIQQHYQRVTTLTKQWQTVLKAF